MGAANVGAVIATWGALPHPAWRVLVAMAHLSLDTAREGQPACRYYAGVGYLAHALRGDDGVTGTDDFGNYIPTPAARRQVERCLTELVRAGAARRVIVGRSGHRAEYEVVPFRPADVGGSPARVSPNARDGLTGSDGATPAGTSPNARDGLSPSRAFGAARHERSVQPVTSVRPQEHQENKEQGEENITHLHHVPAHATTAGDNGQGWSDVALVVEAVTGDEYAAASAYLERTVGSARAGDAAAAYIDAHPGAGYMDAVVTVARQNGWNAA